MTFLSDSGMRSSVYSHRKLEFTPKIRIFASKITYFHSKSLFSHIKITILIEIDHFSCILTRNQDLCKCKLFTYSVFYVRLLVISARDIHFCTFL